MRAKFRIPTAVRCFDASGFALLEVLVTAGLVVAIAASASHILGIALRATHEARVRTLASMYAAEKLEQLRSLVWTHITTLDPAISMSSSDLTTDLSVDPSSDAGPGLLPSPPGTLAADVDSYVDYLDGSGRIVAGRLPAAAVYIRRWAVRPLESDPDNILVLSVMVTTRAPDGAASRDAVRLATIVARK
jgi:type II secretory pathway pseudopilin PulG